MNLRELAEADLAFTLEDGAFGFGWPITITTPAEVVSNPLTGYSNDISQVVDPDTGMLVSGRVATVALRISSLTADGLAIPHAIASKTQRPWLITFDDINGQTYTFKVKQSNPDRGLGVVTLILENWSA